MILRTSLIALVFVLLGVSINIRAPKAGADPRMPVVVELFTSEGCSSCPPADEFLIRLEREQPVDGAQVIALSQHVDYWNRLGWTDPFSSPLFTRRQNAYADAFGNGTVYTPQMVVDGREEFVGSDTARARQAIARAAQHPKARVEISQIGNDPGSSEPLLKIVARDWPPDLRGELEVILAVSEMNLISDVRRGENSGRRMMHTGVVRTLVSAGKFNPTNSTEFSVQRPVKLGGDWKRGDLHAVVFLQEIVTGRIVGAASVPLAP